MKVPRQKIVDALTEQWLDTFKDRLDRFYNNEVTETSEEADKQLRNSLTELKRAFEESVTIVDEFFPDDLEEKGL